MPYGDDGSTVTVTVRCRAVAELDFKVTEARTYQVNKPTQTTVPKAGGTVTFTISHDGWGKGGTYTGVRYVHATVNGSPVTVTVDEPATPGATNTVTIDVAAFTGDVLSIEITDINASAT